jgi:hypothetical protein
MGGVLSRSKAGATTSATTRNDDEAAMIHLSQARRRVRSADDVLAVFAIDLDGLKTQHCRGEFSWNGTPASPTIASGCQQNMVSGVFVQGVG